MRTGMSSPSRSAMVGPRPPSASVRVASEVRATVILLSVRAVRPELLSAWSTASRAVAQGFASGAVIPAARRALSVSPLFPEVFGVARFQVLPDDRGVDVEADLFGEDGARVRRVCELGPGARVPHPAPAERLRAVDVDGADTDPDRDAWRAELVVPEREQLGVGR